METNDQKSNVVMMPGVTETPSGNMGLSVDALKSYFDEALLGCDQAIVIGVHGEKIQFIGVANSSASGHEILGILEMAKQAIVGSIIRE